MNMEKVYKHLKAALDDEKLKVLVSYRQSIYQVISCEMISGEYRLWAGIVVKTEDEREYTYSINKMYLLKSQVKIIPVSAFKSLEDYINEKEVEP